MFKKVSALVMALLLAAILGSCDFFGSGGTTCNIRFENAGSGTLTFRVGTLDNNVIVPALEPDVVQAHTVSGFYEMEAGHYYIFASADPANGYLRTKTTFEFLKGKSYHFKSDDHAYYDPVIVQ